MSRAGALISFSGLDGAGKTTQARGLGRWLAGLGLVTTVLAPDGPSAARRALGAMARQAGLADHLDVLGPDETHLVTAFLRYRDWDEHVVPALARPGFVVTDRCAVCHYAAAAAVGATNEPVLRQVLGLMPVPDLVIYLDLAPQQAYARLHERGVGTEELAFLAANDAAYRAAPEFAGFVVLDGGAGVDEVAASVRAAVAARWPVVRAAAG